MSNNQTARLRRLEGLAGKDDYLLVSVLHDVEDVDTYVARELQAQGRDPANMENVKVLIGAWMKI
jgi:hypothetical protein